MSPWSVPIALVLLGVGCLWLSETRRAKHTGVTSFTGQWPDGFDRELNPWRFRYTVLLHTVVGWVCVAGGSALLVASLFQLGTTVLRIPR